MKVVLIEWMDAHGASIIGWRTLREVSDSQPSVAYSIGYLVKESAKHVVVCPHVLVDDNGNVEYGDGEISIPRSWIRKMKVLQR